jgi:hypothetical protein
MSMKEWEDQALSVPGAAERVAQIEDELPAVACGSLIFALLGVRSSDHTADVFRDRTDSVVLARRPSAASHRHDRRTREIRGALGGQFPALDNSNKEVKIPDQLEPRYGIEP